MTQLGALACIISCLVQKHLYQDCMNHLFYMFLQILALEFPEGHVEV